MNKYFYLIFLALVVCKLNGQITNLGVVSVSENTKIVFADDFTNKDTGSFG